MAVTAREQDIVDQHNSGRSAADIAQDLGLDVGYVRSRIAWLCFNLGFDRKHEQMMEAGSRALLHAIEQARAHA